MTYRYDLDSHANEIIFQTKYSRMRIHLIRVVYWADPPKFIKHRIYGWDARRYLYILQTLGRPIPATSLRRYPITESNLLIPNFLHHNLERRPEVDPLKFELTCQASLIICEILMAG